MPASSTTVLDQIARFFILLSGAPAYWFTINASCDHASQLSKRLGIDEDDYKKLLIAANLARYKGNAFCIAGDEWKSFLMGHHLFVNSSLSSPFQFDKKRVSLNNTRGDVYVVRIGWVGEHSLPNINIQLIQDRHPPRINSLRIHKQSFRRATELAIARTRVDLFVEETPAPTPMEENTATQQPALVAVAVEAANGEGKHQINPGVVRQMYPILGKFYGDGFDPYDESTQQSIRSMLTEIIHLLDSSRGGLKVKDFGGHEVEFVRVPRSSTDKSFNNNKSWVDDALKVNGSTHGGTYESAFRVSNHLCRFYRDSFVAAIEKQGMAIAQPMSTVEYVAMLSALNITGARERELTKYLRQYIGKAFCPTQNEMSMLTKGHTKVYTGSILWTYEGKSRKETVEWSEKHLHTEIETQLCRILRSRNVKPSDVLAVEAVVGGDHGDTAFQFGAAVTATLVSGEHLYFEVTTCELICRKDTAALLEQTILPKLTTGLNVVTTRPLHIYLTDNKKLTAHFDYDVIQEDVDVDAPPPCNHYSRRPQDIHG